MADVVMKHGHSRHFNSISGRSLWLRFSLGSFPVYVRKQCSIVSLKGTKTKCRWWGEPRRGKSIIQILTTFSSHDIHHQPFGIKKNFSQPFFTWWDRLLNSKYMALFFFHLVGHKLKIDTAFNFSLCSYRSCLWHCFGKGSIKRQTQLHGGECHRSISRQDTFVIDTLLFPLLLANLTSHPLLNSFLITVRIPIHSPHPFNSISLNLEKLLHYSVLPPSSFFGKVLLVGLADTITLISYILVNAPRDVLLF
jgi:hypothetical protein